MTGDGLDLDRDGADWPNRAASRVVKAAGLRWHVQTFGAPSRPAALLLHGTGASTHSFRDVAPRLSEHFFVVAADAPGHGFTSSPPSYRLSLLGMSAAFADLCAALDLRPDLVVGHSAGAAIALRMTLDRKIAPRAIVAFNAALRPFQGSAGVVFPALARALFLNPLTPRAFAWSADRRRVERLLGSTGSTISPEAVAQYQRLFRSPKHVAGALGMMAHWSLAPLVEELPRLETPLTLVVGETDGTVPPSVSREVAGRVATASLETWADAGHLAHEEHPERAAALCRRVWAAAVEDPGDAAADGGAA